MKNLLIVLLFVYFYNHNVLANTIIAPNDSLIAFDGVFFVDLNPDTVIFHRLTEEVINDPESDFIAQIARTQSGIIIRFRTRSDTIIAKFVELGGESRGMDFGVYQDSVWDTNYTSSTFEIISNNSSELITYEIVLPSFHNVGFLGLELVDNQPLEKNILVNKPRYVAIGNSVTHGSGQGSASYLTYPYLLAHKAGWELFNLAISAARISPPIGSMFPDPDIDIITIFLGFNDWNRIHDLDQFIAKYQELIDNIRDHHLTTSIYCITPYTTRTEAAVGNLYSIGDYQQAIRDIVTLYQANADTNLFLIEGSHLIAHNDFHDYVHLNIGGAARVADRLYDIIAVEGNYTPPSQKIVINEMLSDPDVSVEWGDANNDGHRDTWEDEFIELLNISDAPISLSSWQIGDDEQIDFQFPTGYILNPYEFVVIFGGGDVSNAFGYDSNPLLTKVFSTNNYIGNGLFNDGDYLVVKSNDGNHDIYLAYGGQANTGLPKSEAVDDITWEFYKSTSANANNNNSLTRFPDGIIDAEDPFIEHLEVNGLYFSPGTTIDGEAIVPIGESYVVMMSMNPEGVGTLNIDTVLALYEYNQVVTFDAMPIYGEGHAFGYWTTSDEGFTSKLNPLTMLITKPQHVVAHFAPRIQITPRIVINEINFDVYKDANGDGIINSHQDEFIEIINISSEDVDLTGWRLGDDEVLSFTFPDGYVIKSGQIVTVFSGGNITGVPGFNANPLKSRVFVSDVIDSLGNGLNNYNEAVLLVSADGTEDMYVQNRDRLFKGDPYIKAAEGIDFEIRFDIQDSTWNNCSVTLFPDGDLSEDDPYVQHKNVALNDSVFSPGQTVDFQNSIVVNAIGDVESGLPETFVLHPNFPNPFNPETTIRFDVPNHSKVSLVIYDILGKEIAKLADEKFNAGYYQLRWSGRDNRGQIVPAGVYFYRIKAEQFSQTNKMILLK